MASPVQTTATHAEGQLVEIMSALESAQAPNQSNFRLTVDMTRNVISGSFTLPVTQGFSSNQLSLAVEEVILPSND
jgi:hypothetical protein